MESSDCQFRQDTSVLIDPVVRMTGCECVATLHETMLQLSAGHFARLLKPFHTPNHCVGVCQQAGRLDTEFKKWKQTWVMVVQGVALESAWHAVACVVSSALAPYVPQINVSALGRDLDRFDLRECSARPSCIMNDASGIHLRQDAV